MKPKIFCIGFHKTGTKSMAVALRTLGYKVTGPNGVNDPNIANNVLDMAFSLVEQYDAFQDNPWPIIYKELDAKYPMSKFILTVRDPDAWINSQVRHFGYVETPMRKWIYDVGCPKGNENIYFERFNKHNRDVLEYFKNRLNDLLVLDLAEGDGWEKLCYFLGTENVPNIPFPHTNKGDDREKSKLRKRSIEARRLNNDKFKYGTKGVYANKSPIFIHSLFRSGSTYFFNVFRRSPTGYFCLQEALHPVVYFFKDEPHKLLKISDATSEQLRHPKMDKPYFHELVSVSSAWQDKITYSALFDGYFGSSEADDGVEFFRAIIDEIQSDKVVFEECRTSGRISLLKEKLGGFHIYLWRNPWDQWWSYKTTNGFDYQNRQIINAPNIFNAVAKLRSRLSFPREYRDTIPKMQDGVFTPEESYLVHYLIWCLGLYEGIKHADLLINIDLLTESESYREEVLTRLSENEIGGLGFSDCQIPRGNYFEDDVLFFSPLEDKIHEWLKDDISIEELNHIQELRKQYQPKNLNKEKSAEQLKNFARQITRLRATSRRFEEAKTIYLQKYLTLNDELKERLEQNERERELLLNEIYKSRSWRLTRPLRWFGDLVRFLLNRG